MKSESGKNNVTTSQSIANNSENRGGKSMPAVPVYQNAVPAMQQLADDETPRQLMPFQLKAGQTSAPVQAKGNKTGLPDNLKTGIENLSSISMDDTRVHYNSSQPAQLNALAYAQGSDIHIAPGQEQHLPHEAWHVVQQKQGRVQPTVQLKTGMPVNDDKALEYEADVMGAKALQSIGKDNTTQLKITNTHTNGTIQAKSATPLATQLASSLAFITANIAALSAKITAYDASTDGRPSAHLAAIRAMLTDLKTWYATNIALVNTNDYNAIIEILANEENINRTQAARLEAHTATADSPYEQMTKEGLLWQHPALTYNVKAKGKIGKAYFEDLSQMNMTSMADETTHIKLNTQAWFEDFIKRATTVLSGAVVNHYTTASRAKNMLRTGGMKSKMVLQKELPSFKNNTPAYDDIGLGNNGFLFFFIEEPNAPIRDTRFSKDDGDSPARISVPIQTSGLLTNGWLMLSDFAQREYPDIMTTAASDKYTSMLSTRKKEKQTQYPEFTKTVRHFEQGSGVPDESDMKQVSEITDKERRQAFFATVSQAQGDKNSKQIYEGPNRKFAIPDQIFHNILVGKDIIPGLAHRAALEVARMSAANSALGAQFNGLQGKELMRFILKDLVRPQAMIPNTLVITEDQIQPHPKSNERLMQMTEAILTLGHKIQPSDRNIMREIDTEMTRIMQMGEAKLDEQVAKMSIFLTQLQERETSPAIGHSTNLDKLSGHDYPFSTRHERL